MDPHAIEMLKYYQDEFKYRHTHLWNILIKFFLLTIGIAIAPITTEVLGFQPGDVAMRFPLCFPITAFVIACFGLYILNDEVKKMRAVQNAKYRINKELMDKKYQYEFYEKSPGTPDAHKKEEKKKWLSVQLPYAAFAVESFIIAISASIILYNLLPLVVFLVAVIVFLCRSSKPKVKK